ncbi:hypothetical protein PUN4_570152 [Paraburkholderia unamae]|nr:hypothetical protein PUN4_570152 [Paraburkholderia unamae]
MHVSALLLVDGPESSLAESRRRS